MYNSSMMHRVLRDPGSEGGGGAAPAGNGGAQGGAGASGAGDAGAQGGGQQTPQYVSKADFDALRNEFSSQLSRFSQQARPESRPADGKSGDPSEPDPSRYDFQKPGELSRYNADLRKYWRHLDKQESAEEARKKEAEEAPRRISQDHYKRVADYKKANPDYDTDRQKAGRIEMPPEVIQSIYGCDDSPAIQHHIFKNPDLAQELTFIAESQGMDALRYRLGKISASIEAEAKIAEANAKAASDRPPRQNFRGNSGSANRTPSMEERFARFNK